MKSYVKKRSNWFCTYTAVKGTLQNCSLSSVYEHFTTSIMPKKHDAQMDVYACATIFCHLKGIKDQSQLIDLISEIESTEIVCQKPMDFWRYARRHNAKQEIKAEDYIDLKNWSICLKWDGFYVRLKRESVDSDKWRMYTRSGNELHPPKSFLESLRSLKFPVGMEMEGELVFDSDQTCATVDQNNVENRIRKRTQDFAKLHISSLRSTKSFTSWHGLRLVLFAFPLMGQTFRESFNSGKKLIVDSQDQHTHITACGYYRLKSTKEAFDIFTTVVQMGCEGVIVRDPNAVYENKTETDKKKSKVFKMKQKIVTDNEQIIELVEVSGQPRRKKDGTEKEEIEYKVTAFKVHDTDRACEFTFKDWRNPVVANGVIEQKLKFHEKAKWKMAWDLNEKGYRHTCFATDQDVSYAVLPKRDDYVNSEYDQEILDTIKNHIFVETKPFKFIVETAYVFLDCVVHQNRVVHNTDKDKIEIGMLRLTGKTDEEIQPQWFLHKEYVRDHRGPIDQQFVADMTHFLHHSPNDNKRLVFVVKDKNVLKIFRTYALDVMVEDRYSNIPKDTIRRLQVNDKARKQQVDVILMEEWKANKLFKTLISWNSDCSAGHMQENHSNENTVCALVSPELSDEKFKVMCAKQFDNCVCLQNLWNEGSRPIKPKSKEIVLEYIDDLQRLDGSYPPGATLAPYFDKLKSLKLSYEVEHKALYNTLLEYDENKTGIITKEDFEKAFEVARQREKNCPNDPFEPLTNKFPYVRKGTDQQAHKNVWHRAWRMSEAFFRCNKMVVSGKAPDVFKHDPDLDLWLPPQQAVARESSSEVEIIEETRPQNPEPLVDKVVKPRRERHPKIKRRLGGSESEDEIKESPKPQISGRETKRPTASKSPKSPPKSPKPEDNFGLTIQPKKIHPRQRAPSSERHSERGEAGDEQANKKSKDDNKKTPRPSAEDWVNTGPKPNPDSPHKDSPHEEPSEYARQWLEKEMAKDKKGSKIKALLQKLKLYA
jgi:hypothetical protein